MENLSHSDSDPTPHHNTPDQTHRIHQPRTTEHTTPETDPVVKCVLKNNNEQVGR